MEFTEGGNQMGSNSLLKKIFIIALTFILICLSVIIAGELPDEEATLSSKIDYSKLKFEVLNKNVNCEEELEELYQTEKETFYTYCKENVYIKWENGKIDLIEDALLDEKINIEDLKNHDIEIVVVDNEN